MNFPSDFRPVVTALTDTDLYKFTMQQVMLHHNPSAVGVTEFFCRNTPLFPLAELEAEVNQQLDWLCTLQFTDEELDFLAMRPYFKADYIEFLRLFKFQRKFITVFTKGDRLCIRAEGPLVHITGFEIHVLTIVNELYFRRSDQKQARVCGEQRLAEKIASLRTFAAGVCMAPWYSPEAKDFEFFDFGTRRRYSRDWHAHVVKTLAEQVPQYFKGTSNVYLAMRYNLVPMGTMAHEHLQKHQGLGGQLRHAQKAALEEWAQEYRGDLGIALTDVINMDSFLRDFDRYFAALFDGMRHDSGDAFIWGEKAVQHYKKLRIEPRTKRLVFSNGLDFETSFALYAEFASRIQTGFGIGTWLSNDVGLVPLNIVMKLLEVNCQPVAKISDDPGKTICKDKVFLRYLCQVNAIAASWLDA